MKKFYLYRFTMETPIGNLPKSEISNYFVTNLDLRFGFTEDWKRRKQDFKSVYGPHAVVLCEWDTELEKNEMREVKKITKQELKESFNLKGDTIENGLSQKEKIITIINKYIKYK